MLRARNILTSSLLRTMATKPRSSLLALIPPNSIDSHMHVFEPTLFPLPRSANQAYAPPKAPIADAIKILGEYTPRMVVVQPSTYGTDNSCQLDGVRVLGGAPKSCAVVEVDPQNVTADELKHMHEEGARGFRVNFVSRGMKPSRDVLRSTLQTYADLARPLGWVVQMYTPLEDIDALADLLEGDALGVPLVLDHFAQPSSPLSSPPGLPTILRILSNPSSRLYIKISAAYRLLPRSTSALGSPLKDLFSAFVQANDERVVFGSDWPHTRYDRPGEVDTMEWMEDVIEWCLDVGGEDGRKLVEKVFKTNAEELWFGRG